MWKSLPFEAYFLGLPTMNYTSDSRRRTPWTGKTDVTPVQRFIDSCNSTNYDKKHPRVKDSLEQDLLNDYPATVCRHCGSTKFKAYGKTAAGTKRYYCKDCHKTFTVITNTIFDQRKIPISEWLDFLLSLMGYGSFILTSKANRNAFNTTKYWFNKVFMLLSDWQDSIVLKGTVYLDETYYSVITSERKVNPDGSKLRGLSINKICIGVAKDENNVIAFVEGKCKPSKKHTWKAFGSHIEPGSKLIHDGDNSHSVLVKKLGLDEEIHTTEETKGLKDENNPLFPINNTHFILKKFLNAHAGFNRDDLQDYLNFFCFVSRNISKFEKVAELMEIAFHKSNFLRYRDQ